MPLDLAYGCISGARGDAGLEPPRTAKTAIGYGALWFARRSA